MISLRELAGGVWQFFPHLPWRMSFVFQATAADHGSSDSAP